MSILGRSIARREDLALLTRGGQYVDDIDPPRALHVTFVRSTIAHARIRSIDTSHCSDLPGVVDVVTAADLDAAGVADLAPESPVLNEAMRRPLLARDTVRFAGEAVAAILTEERHQGTDAAESVVVDYEPVEAVIDPLRAAEDSTNIAMTIDAGRLHADFSDCEVVVSRTIRNQRVAPCPIETRSAAAWWEGDPDGEGRLVQYQSCQGTHPLRDQLVEFYGLPADRVRVVCPDVGGSFGSKAGIFPEGLLLGFLARRAKRPVRWFESRTDNMMAMGHGRGQVQTVTIGGSRDGHISAYKLDVVQDSGAYPMMGALLPWMTRTMLTGVYDIATAEFSSRSVVTNTTPTVAYRGAGRPEAAAAIERAVDLFAAEIGADPAEVRRRNLIAPSSFPFTTPAGTVYDSGDYERALDLALDGAGYAELRAEQARRREGAGGPATTQLGIGMSIYVEITALGSGAEFGSCELRADGGVRVVTGSNPYGQGHQTAWAQLVSAKLGIPTHLVEVVYGDTDLVPAGAITGGSRSVQLAGSAIWDASTKLLEVATHAAAGELGAAPSDVVLDPAQGRFHIAGTPSAGVTWAELGEAALAGGDPLVGLSDFSSAGPTFPFGAHVAVVEVDVETGRVELLRLVAVDDAGTILNPLLAEGQVHGGLAQGAAQALFEEVLFDEAGNPLTATFADYGIPSATEVPFFERIMMETPTPMNPLGAKGIGESGAIGATPAVQNAVIDALSHLGVRHIDMPCTPERVWQAITSRT